MGTYTGAEQALVTQWVKDRLLAQAAIFDALVIQGVSVGSLSTRIHEDFAPPGETYPFIIHQCQVPPRDIRGVGVTRVMVDTMYVVKAVAQVPSYGLLAPIASVIDSAMTSAAGGAVADGLVLAAVRREQFALTEIDNGKQYRHFGGVYKIHATAQA